MAKLQSGRLEDTPSVSRREFLKSAGAGSLLTAATGGVLSGWGDTRTGADVWRDRREERGGGVGQGNQLTRSHRLLAHGP